MAAITTTAYAGKNHKAEGKNKTIKPQLQQVQTTPPLILLSRAQARSIMSLGCAAMMRM